ncbi:MAG: hypothetical protein WCJ41_19305 [Aestuariivirga sp.]|jgi:hypothetical protein|uniref:hypothetical protein n=1 Tax=Aestuariivirga sp. TaxID=2650926 RepID=UPI0030162376
MEEKAFMAIKLLPREELESFAVHAALHMRENHRELESGRCFSVLLVGFALGALVAAAGFLIGASLS